MTISLKEYLAVVILIIIIFAVITFVYKKNPNKKKMTSKISKEIDRLVDEINNFT